MKLLLSKISALLLLLFFFTSSCDSNRSDFSKYLEASEEEWLLALKEIGGDLDQLDNTVLLISNYTSCGACLAELQTWNRRIKEFSQQEVLIKLIVVDEFIERVEAFKNQNNFVFDIYHDQNALIAKNNLIPGLPVKVLFDETGVLKKNSTYR